MGYTFMQEMWGCPRRSVIFLALYLLMTLKSAREMMIFQISSLEIERVLVIYLAQGSQPNLGNLFLNMRGE